MLSNKEPMVNPHLLENRYGVNETFLYEIKINPFRFEYAVSKQENLDLNRGNQVLIQIYKEVLLGQITKMQKMSQLIPEIRSHIIRLATETDIARKESFNRQSEEVRMFFEQLLKRFQLSAKVVLIDWDFNQSKVYCYLISERKINYLLLHETATDSLKTRVAIKQVGIRDFARSIGGLGVCGRELCCSTFLNTIQSVTLTMARQQSIYIEPEKISGACGKLRCCISFETKQKEK
jgi:cell fate regulator YaaT (PSP1 superfamily)